MDNNTALQFYPVRGYSMRPLMKDGDVVKVRLGPGSFGRADVVLYKSGSNICCHRIARKVDHPSHGYMVQCDFFPGHLTFVGMDDIVGKAVAFGRGVKFASLERGRYRIFGEALIFIGLYMSWIPDLLRKAKLFINGEIDLNDLRLDAVSYASNFTRAQRSYRRSRFPLEKLICGPITEDDRVAYEMFIERHSRDFRKGIDSDYFPDLIRTIGPEHLYYVARFEGKIIGSVRMHCACKAEGMRFWFVSEVYVLREFHGKGIGERLINLIIAKANGSLDVPYLSVNGGHFKAISLYKKLGFREEDALRNIVVRTLYDKADMSTALFLFKRTA